MRPLDFVSKIGYSKSMKESIMEEQIIEKAYKIFYDDKEQILHGLARQIDRYPYVKEILIILAAGTVLSALIVMPGLARILDPRVWQGDGYRKRRLRQVVKRLFDKKLVEMVETKDGPVVRITQHGMTKALKYKLEEMKLKKPKSWDKKWRVVIFDIPEGKRKLRDEFRKRLRQLGFFQLQKSVFVHAFPCDDEIEFLRQVYSVPIDVTVITATKIENEDRIRRFFNI